MAQFPPFVLPPGVSLRVTEQGIHLAYEGDIATEDTGGPDQIRQWRPWRSPGRKGLGHQRRL